MLSILRMDRAQLRTEFKETVALAAPLVFGQLFSIGMNVIDTLLAGHFNAHTLAAVAVGTSVWSLAIVTAIGVMLALPPSVAQLAGAGERERIGPLFRQALWLAMGLGVALWFGARHGEILLSAIGVDRSILDDTHRFLRAIAWGAPALTGYFALRGLSEGMSLTRPTMYFGALGLILLLPIGYTLMYGKLGLPALGAEGSGIATACVLWLQFLAFALYLAIHKNYRDVAPFAHFEVPDWHAIVGLLRLGVPMGISVLMEAGLFVAAALLLGSLGATTVASHQIAINVASVAFMIPLGVAMATTVRVGNAVGRADALGIRRAGYVGIATTLLTQTISCLLMVVIPHALAGLYTDDAQVAALAAQLLLLAAAFQFSDGIQVTANGALRGLKDTAVPMLITTIAYWAIGMPVGWWLAFHAGFGARGMWMGLIAGLSVAAVLLFVRFATHAAHRDEPSSSRHMA